MIAIIVNKILHWELFWNFSFSDFMGSQEGAFDTRLHEAVRYGDIEEVKVALQQSYDPNLIGLYQWSALHEASSNGESEIVKLLLSKKGIETRCIFYSDS